MVYLDRCTIVLFYVKQMINMIYWGGKKGVLSCGLGWSWNRFSDGIGTAFFKFEN